MLAAIEDGDIDEGHYGNWMKMRREAAHYERSYVERRKREGGAAIVPGGPGLPIGAVIHFMSIV